MAQQISSLSINMMTGLGGLNAGLGQARGMLSSFASSVLGIGSRIGGLTLAIDGIGRAAGALASPMIDGVRGAIGLETQLGKIATLLDEDAESRYLAGIGEGINDLAGEFGQSTETLGKGVYDLISAGVDAGDAIDILRISSEAAVGGMTDTATAVDGLTSALNAYGYGADMAGAVSDQMAAAVASGKMEFGQLAGSIGQVAPTAASAGVALESVLGLMSQMTSRGIGASESATGINNVIKSFVAATPAARKAAEQLGIALEPEALQGDRLADTLRKLATLDIKQRATIFTDFDAQKAINLLTADVEGALANIDNASVANAAGTRLEQFGDVAETTSFRLQQMSAKIGTAMRRLGSTVLPIVGMVGSGVVAVVDRINGWIGPRLEAMTSMATAAASRIGTGVAWLSGKASAAMGAIVEWIGPRFSSGVALALGYWRSLYNAVAAIAGALWGAVGELWSAGASLLGYESDRMGSSVGDAFNGIVSAAGWMQGKVTFGFNSFAFGLNHFGDLAEWVGMRVALSVVTMGNEIAHVFTGVIPDVLQWLSRSWREILVSLFDYTTTVFSNLAGNIYEIVSNLPGLISGDKSFDDLWTPLTDGFRSSMAELPDIAAREVGDVEAALRQRSDDLGGEIASGYSDYMAAQAQAAEAGADSITRGCHELPGSEFSFASMTAANASRCIPLSVLASRS